MRYIVIYWNGNVKLNGKTFDSIEDAMDEVYDTFEDDEIKDFK